jgi:hypothetical protein
MLHIAAIFAAGPIASPGIRKNRVEGKPTRFFHRVAAQ